MIKAIESNGLKKVSNPALKENMINANNRNLPLHCNFLSGIFIDFMAKNPPTPNARESAVM